MSLSEKIMYLRKRNGWSQEELGDRLGISRQSVSKWESGMSVPDIDKIIKLSELFGVSTDYLLKEEQEGGELLPAEPVCAPEERAEAFTSRYVDAEEAGSYLAMARRTAGKYALATCLCILSPVCLLILGGLSEEAGFISENAASGIGVAVLLLLVAAGVALFVTNGMLMSRFEYLEKEDFVLDNSMLRRVEELREEGEPAHRRAVTLGVVLCIVGVVPLMLALALESEMACILAVCLILVFCAAGVYLLVRSGCVFGSYQKLLQAGDYTPEKKEQQRRTGVFATVYWCLVTALYLGVSFYLDNWDRSWIIWAVAGVLYAAVYGIVLALSGRKS